jgi:cell fate (sporulation/competence/biofilm development) regulator YmcA (YheA/YmcA/DUF963 family)
MISNMSDFRNRSPNVSQIDNHRQYTRKLRTNVKLDRHMRRVRALQQQATLRGSVCNYVA